MRHAPALVVALCSLLLLGCPGPTAPGPDPTQPGSGTQPDLEGPKGEEDPVADRTDTPPNSGGSSWEVIDEETRAKLSWPVLQELSTWPAPAALADLPDTPSEDLTTRATLLRQLVELLVHTKLHPGNFDAARKTDTAGHVHLAVGRNRPQGSATLDSHGPKFPPVFTLVIEKPGPRATNVAALREAVAQIVPPDLAKELAQKDNMLEPDPKVPGAAMAFLDRSGYGAQFPYLYAYSSEGQLVLVFQEVPHGTAPR